MSRGEAIKRQALAKIRGLTLRSELGRIPEKEALAAISELWWIIDAIGGDKLEPKPSIGRIVHYTNLGDVDGKFPLEAQAAIITGLNQNGTVSLHILYRTGQFDMPSVEYTSAAAGTQAARGKWTWPARA